MHIFLVPLVCLVGGLAARFAISVHRGPLLPVSPKPRPNANVDLWPESHFLQVLLNLSPAGHPRQRSGRLGSGERPTQIPACVSQVSVGLFSTYFMSI